MKIGIITINSENMGNRLQNYALQKVLENKGAEVRTLNNPYCGREVRTLKHTAKMCLTERTLPWIYSRRRQRFYAFNDRFIHTDPRVLKPNQVPAGIADEYDFFICGSDQVWNPYFSFITSNEFLRFARPEQRIAYAASIGVSKMDDATADRFKKLISNFKAVSVRESAGASLIHSLTGADVPVIVDPTMMLDANEWLRLASRPAQMPSHGYILTYFLGNKTERTKELERKISEEKGYEVVNLLDVHDPRYYFTDPSEFVYLVAHSNLVLTDSFHASVFSVLMGTSFAVQGRVDKNGAADMGSRIESLLGMLDLKSHYLNADFQTKVLSEIDYSHAYEVLKKERQKADHFLERALK